MRLTLRDIIKATLCVIVVVTGCNKEDLGQPLHVARATFCGVSTNDSLCHSEFILTEPLAGVFLTNRIRVTYFSVSAPASIPSNALLVLQPFDIDLETGMMVVNKGGDYVALGGEARYGILQDTPANRKAVIAGLMSLAANRVEDMLPFDKAVAIAWEAIRKEIGEAATKLMNLECVRRDDYGYGWVLHFSWYKGDIYDVTGSVVVGDDGIVKDVSGFPPDKWTESYLKYGKVITSFEASSGSVSRQATNEPALPVP